MKFIFHVHFWAYFTKLPLNVHFPIKQTRAFSSGRFLVLQIWGPKASRFPLVKKSPFIIFLMDFQRFAHLKGFESPNGSWWIPMDPNGSYSRLICRGNQVIPGNHRFQGTTDSRESLIPKFLRGNSCGFGTSGSRGSLVPGNHWFHNFQLI